MGLGIDELLLVMILLGMVFPARWLVISAVAIGSSGRSKGCLGTDPDRAEKIYPDCAASVLAEARACKRCGYRFEAKP